MSTGAAMILDGHEPASIATAMARLRAGELVGLPTETVYGLGADAENDAAANDLVVACRHCRLSKGVERTCPDIAVDNPDAAERQRQESRRRVMPCMRRRRGLVRAVTHLKLP